MGLRACHGSPGSSRREAALEAQERPTRAGLDSFLDIEIDKSISMPASPRVEEDAMPRRVNITPAGAKQVWHNGRLCSACAKSTIGGTGIPPFRGVPPQDREGDEK